MMRNFCHFPTVQTHKLFRMPFFCPTNLHTRQNGSSAISSSSRTIISQNLRSTSIPGNLSSPKHKSLGCTYARRKRCLMLQWSKIQCLGFVTRYYIATSLGCLAFSFHPGWKVSVLVYEPQVLQYLILILLTLSDNRRPDLPRKVCTYIHHTPLTAV